MNNVPRAYKCINTHVVTLGIKEILILSNSRVYNELIVKWHYALIINIYIQSGIIDIAIIITIYIPNDIIDIAFVNHFK